MQFTLGRKAEEVQGGTMASQGGTWCGNDVTWWDHSGTGSNFGVTVWDMVEPWRHRVGLWRNRVGHGGTMA